jgi:hypothetical protein
MKNYITLNVRPYQLMCIVCKVGAGYTSDLGDKKLNEIFNKIRKHPYIPITLRCNVDTRFRYQNPGTEGDTPEGETFNIKRDLDILYHLRLVPGTTLPANEIFHRFFKYIITAKGICGYDRVSSKDWKGCTYANSGNYEKGHAMGLDNIIPVRKEEEKARVKIESVEATYKTTKINLRPCHLMCITCFHGGEKNIKPIKEDNLYEVIVVVQKNPDIPVTLTNVGDCMICPPCSIFDKRSRACVGYDSQGLRSYKKDMAVLQKLGLDFGITMPAKKLFKLLYEKITSEQHQQICTSNNDEQISEWSFACANHEAYRKGREAGLGIAGLKF